MWHKILTSTVVALILFCSGCSTTVSPFEAGLAGGVLGATTGGIIGANIRNGNVGRSMGLGAAIGIPLAVGSVYAERYLEERNRRKERELVAYRQERLNEREGELLSLRDEVRREHPHIQSTFPPEYRYNGPTLGNYYR